MKSLLRLTDLLTEEIYEIFKIADALSNGGYKNYLNGKSVILFLPESSIRTRVTFEKGIHLLGGQSLLFSSETLDKKEAVADVAGYLSNWADLLIVRHRSIEKIENMAERSKVPVINAMTGFFLLAKMGTSVLHGKRHRRLCTLSYHSAVAGDMR